jgi:glycosyltransferase involved in cell wall biosynthesis
MGARSRRYLIDGTMARGGGGFTYLFNVMPRLARRNPGDRFRLLLRSPRLADAIAPAPNLEVSLLPEAGLRERLRFTYREAPRIARSWQADLYFSAGEYAPVVAPCPRIAAFRNPNVFSDVPDPWPLRQQLRLWALRGLAELSARSCDRILFVSEDSARWIGDRARIPAARRAVVHHGIDLATWKPSGGGCLHGSPYILSVSSIYRYKNFVRLVEAYAHLARTMHEVPDLVILGDDQDPDYSAQLRRTIAGTGELAQRIHLIGEVPYEDVRRYYQNASLFVFPSYLETFGHPLLEAMASGLPVVASDIPVFREIASDAAFYADPHDPQSMARAMGDVLRLEAARELLVKRALERVRDFTWERSAEGLMALFESVLAERADRAPAALPKPPPRRPRLEAVRMPHPGLAATQHAQRGAIAPPAA